MTDKPWKLVLLLVGIFAAGAVAGSFVTMRVGRNLIQRKMGVGPEQWGPQRLKMMTERLELTPEQQEKLSPIIQHDMQELARIRRNSFAETRRIVEQMNREIAAVLTPEQKVKFDEMNRELRERMQRFMRERRPGGGPRPWPDAPPGDRLPPPPAPPKDKSPEV
jgi:Spy/CpxP family protein refolding chaperone